MIRRFSVFRGVVFLGVLGGVVGGAWWWNTQETVETQTLDFSGTIDIREVVLSFPVGGRVVEMLFEEGESVSAGAVLARLDAERLTDRVAAAHASLSQQQALLDRLLAGTRPEEIAVAEADVTAAEARLTLAQLTLTRKSTLAGTPGQSRAQLDEAIASRDEAAAMVAAKRHTLTLLHNGSRSEDIEAARAGRDVLRHEMSIAEKDLADAMLTAPETGIILTKVVEPGTIVPSGGTVYVLSLSSPLRVRAYIDEPRLGLIRPGMRVEILSDSRPDKPYHGTIGFIAPTAEFTPKAVHTPDLRTKLVFRFRVTLEDGDDLLRQGMPVTVRLSGNTREREE